MKHVDPTRLQMAKSLLGQLTQDELVVLIPDLAAFLRRTATEYWWMKKDVFDAFEAHGFHVTQDHYYSAQPSVTRLPPALWDGPRYLPRGFAFDLDGMRSLFDEIAPFASELSDLPATASSGFYWENAFFPNFDAIVYYGLCRRFAPSVILEVGSGFSTHIALRAAERNGTTAVRCIEPYPMPALLQVRDRLSSLIEARVQDVPLEVYSELRPGDVLFVDTSHVSKIESDLHHILFRVLPALPAGVLIHFHDIFLPREYPPQWVLERNWFWNEQYLLLAFLMYNEAFRPLFMSNHFLVEREEVAKGALAGLGLGPLQGASFWLRKETP